MSCCEDDETPVVFGGTNFSAGTPTSELTVIGPENAVPDPKRCGAGRRDECCIFLVLGPNGFECERHGAGRYRLIFAKRRMSAQREPTALYPGCMFDEATACGDTVAAAGGRVMALNELVEDIVATLPPSPERTVALRTLLEAKDAAVRENLARAKERAAGEDVA